MIFRKNHPKFLIALIFGCIFVFSTIFSPITHKVYAEPQNETTEVSPNIENTGETENTSESSEENSNNTQNNNSKANSSSNSTGETATSCHDQVGAIAWIVCPSTGALAKAIDSIYGLIKNLLLIKPLTTDSTSPITAVWEYSRNITNIVFIIFLLVVIYSQLTGIGFSNYNIKKVLPKVIISAILINLSFHICSIAVDISNILGSSLVNAISSVGESAISSGSTQVGLDISVVDVFNMVTGGGVIAGLSVQLVGLAGGFGSVFWMLVPVIFGAAVSVIVGLLTISFRQAVVSLLVMISPLAFVAYLLPNTEKWYKKWVDIFFQMLIFYPTFSLLFAASRLAGWVLITGATDLLGVILGLAVQIFPLIMSASIMKMSGSVLGKLSSKLDNYGNKLNSKVSDFSKTRENLARQNYLNKQLKNPTPNFLSGGYWLAYNARRNQKLKNELSDSEANTANLLKEQLNARKIGTRIIGYTKDGAPIYSRKPVKVTAEMRKEYEKREIELRAKVSDLKMDNSIGAIGSYMTRHNLNDAKLSALLNRQGNNFLDFQAQSLAKSRNDQADKRWANEQFRDAINNRTTNPSKYEKLIIEGAGSDYYNKDLYSADPTKRAQAKKYRDDAILFTEASAFEQYETERQAAVKKYTSYYDSQKTKDVKTAYQTAVQNTDIDTILAIHSVFAKRGDFDAISEGVKQLMDNGDVKLGHDFANRLALNLLGMKDAAPSLARLGKFINMETWQYSIGNRTEESVLMKDFVTGKDASGRRTATNLIDAMQGTSLKGIDRTSMDVIDIMLEDSYFNNNQEQLDTMRHLMKSMMPQIVSALPTFNSGSEQITKLLKFFTGAKYNNSSGAYDINTNENADQSDYYYQNTKQYLESLTAENLLEMKSDTFNAIMARLEKKNGSKNGALNEFRSLCHNNVQQILSGDKSALNKMKPKIMEALGISPTQQP